MSPGFVSVDPLMLADSAGGVHLFWAERLMGAPNALGGSPDSMMYAKWDGASWSKPIDIHISPPEMANPRIAGIRGVIDDSGVIHLVWMGPDGLLNYSSAPAEGAGSAQSWSKAYEFVDDHNGIQYAAGLAYQQPDTVHVAYGRARENLSQTLEYVRSFDGGLSWAQPEVIYYFPGIDRGASNVRVTIDAPDSVYVTWTEFDASGNGQAVYFMRSLDGGDTWDRPVMLDEREEDDYERDWMNLVSLDDGRLMAFWEGGFRAYPQAQYSEDGGVTWSEPIDTLYWLIADNGPAEFLRDSADRLHLFIVRRIREGYPEKCDLFPDCVNDGNAIWHSTWEGGTTWREPRPLEFTSDNYAAVAMELGKYVHVAYFGYSGDDPFEIRVMRCEIPDVEALQPQPLPVQQSISEAVALPVPTAEPIATVAPTATPIFLGAAAANEPAPNSGPGSMLLFSGLPVLGIVTAVVTISAVRNRRKR